ncbi:UMP kinase [Candidatus Profftia sp. (ex Adelges kitamiensis)]|uniref:UMP kinase n=1 Tax=Candidatus Profftia sp. (ex Adelges kitamiensis) TaxID=2864218 RepID=UPI001CE25398|nr:UMP kinase [Candidatus Profftia sp. (ex Adelges kitamiensis)]
MTINSKCLYHRILLKISGESLQGSENFGINAGVLKLIVQEIKDLVELGIQVGIVIGGGNLFRGYSLARIGISRIVGDHMGILATVINGLAMRDALLRSSINTYLMSAIPLHSICDNYNWVKAISLLRNNHVVIFSAGTGNPLCTTDSAACLRGIEIEADIVLKATKVSGVYSSDPLTNLNATLFNRISYKDVLEKKLQVMDLAAFILARDHNLPICIFNINKLGAMRRIVMGEKEGTLICK